MIITVKMAEKGALENQAAQSSISGYNQCATAARQGKEAMPATVALTLTKWALDALTKLVKADVRVHNSEVIRNDMAVLFAVNHFTRLETILLPYYLHRHTDRVVHGLAAAELFQGPVGEFLQSAGAVSTAAPDRDKIIVRSLLEGRDAWMIFPEGMMIKDKKVIDARGEFEVYSKNGRRPPHKGAAVLALRTEFYRHKLDCIHTRPKQEGLAETLERFGLSSAEQALGRHTVIVPVNITYFPIRAHENLILRLASRLSEGGLSKRAVEELSVEGTVLSEETDIDITLGEPIDMREYLAQPEHAALMACGLQDMSQLEQDPASLFNDAAVRLMRRYMAAIYERTTINHDHLFATLVRHQGRRRWSERQYRNRMYLCARELRQLGRHRMHSLLERHHQDIVSDEPCPRFDDFLGLCLREHLLELEGAGLETRYRRNGHPHPDGEAPDFHSIRARELAQVIANEIEPIPEAIEIIRRTGRMAGPMAAKRVRTLLMDDALREFEEEYARYYDPELSKAPEAGRPFLLKPWRVRGGVVLAHGYMAAPMEVRAMAEYFCQQGYAVYGVRLPGHGTSPASLAQTHWEEWYQAFSRGYAIMRNLTDTVFLGGFSTGGCLALRAAARKGAQVRGVFAVCAPRKLQSYSVHLAPSAVTLSALLKRAGSQWDKWDYVDNHPENPHINYTRNPLAGVVQLMHAIDAMEEALPLVRIPTLIVQASRDHLVNPDSGPQIFERLGCADKELLVLERKRHGIVNGPGSEEVFERVAHFLRRIESGAPAVSRPQADSA